MTISKQVEVKIATEGVTSTLTKIEPSIEWGFSSGQVSLTDTDTKAWAEFFINNLTKKNKVVLSGLLPLMVKMNGWLSPDVAMRFSIVIEDRTPALIDAIVKKKISSNRIPSLSRQTQRHIVGAAICELINSGYRSDFFISLNIAR